MEASTKQPPVIADVQAHIQAFIGLVVESNTVRVGSQRLCYNLQDEARYEEFNNPTTKTQLKENRVTMLKSIKNISRQITHFRHSAEMGTNEFVCTLQEFVIILLQLYNDLKDVCNSYCGFITNQYQVINPYISVNDIKTFISQPEKPFLLPRVEETESGVDLRNPVIKIIITEILYRRQDLHLIIEILRIIDSVLPTLQNCLDSATAAYEYETSQSSSCPESSDEEEQSSISSGSVSDDDGEENRLIFTPSPPLPPQSRSSTMVEFDQEEPQPRPSNLENLVMSMRALFGGSQHQYQHPSTASTSIEQDEDVENDGTVDVREKLLRSTMMRTRPSLFLAWTITLLVLILVSLSALMFWWFF